MTEVKAETTAPPVEASNAPVRTSTTLPILLDVGTNNVERLKDPAVDTMLAKLAGAESTADQTAALEPIAKYVAANLPIIPTTTSSQWFEYNSQNYTGWPTQDNPYETGQPSGTNNGPGSGTDEVVILHLIPR